MRNMTRYVYGGDPDCTKAPNMIKVATLSKESIRVTTRLKCDQGRNPNESQTADPLRGTRHDHPDLQGRRPDQRLKENSATPGELYKYNILVSRTGDMSLILNHQVASSWNKSLF
jgi:hypothetical protein